MTPSAQPLEWLTVDDAARLCHRAPRTIRNLISKHQLPVRRLWLIRRRKRFRVMMLSPGTTRRLQELTLEAPLHP